MIDGKAIAQAKLDDLKQIITNQNLSPKLAIILANDNPASQIYVSRKMKICADIGIDPILIEFPKTVSNQDITDQIQSINNDPLIHGLFLQLPVWDHLNTDDLIQSIDPKKDVDGLTHINLGKVMAGDKSGLVPCTPQGVMAMLDHEKIDLNGKHAVIIGRSLLFGKPMGQLLLNANCTVTQCHSKTVDLPSITKQGDILIAAVGQPKMVKADWVKQGATVIDVGITKMDDGKLSGDVDFDKISKITNAITPVPGGVGPMTVACLMANVVKACKDIKTD